MDSPPQEALKRNVTSIFQFWSQSSEPDMTKDSSSPVFLWLTLGDASLEDQELSNLQNVLVGFIVKYNSQGL